MNRYFMNRYLVGAATATALAMSAGTAAAADMQVKAPVYQAPPPIAIAPSWTGCYIGGNMGVGWVDSHVRDEIDGSPIASLSDTNVVGGGQVGCDYQFTGYWVIGVQGMIDGSALKASTTSPVLNPLTLQGKIPWFATVTGRLGYAFAPNALFYAKGGGAWTHSTATLFLDSTVIDSVGFDQSGWTAGGGVEWRFSSGWSIFVEYDYLGFRDKTVSFPNTNNIGVVRQNVQVVLVGVNLRFGGGPSAVRY